MFVFVFAWGLHRKLASRLMLGPVSFMAITRALFLSQANLIAYKGVKKFPKYFELFWATIRQITSYWGNMTSSKEYYASRDASKVYLFYCFSRWRACRFCVSPWLTWVSGSILHGSIYRLYRNAAKYCETLHSSVANYVECYLSSSYTSSYIINVDHNKKRKQSPRMRRRDCNLSLNAAEKFRTYIREI
jgi:hypothetical protein